MSDDAVHRRVDRADIIYAYHVALGREPESQTVVQDLLRHAGPDWLTGFFTSGEFIEKVRRKLERGLDVTGELFNVAPTADLIAWVSQTIILDDSSRTAVLGTRSWHDLFTVLFADERFMREVLHEEGLDDRLIAKLKSKPTTAPIKGEIDYASASEVRGWAINQDDPAQSLVIDLHIDGQLVAATPVALLRRELQDQFGGDGRCGFLLRFDVPGTGARFREARLTERHSGVLVATAMLDFSPAASQDVAAALRAEIALLRSALERVEARLPALTLAMGFSLSAYDDYFRAYYRHSQRLDRSVLPIAVLVDGVGATARELDELLRSIDALDDDPSELIVLYDATVDKLILRAMLRSIEGRIACRLLDVGRNEDVEQALTRAARDAQAAGLLVVRPDGALARDALGAFARALEQGAGLVFADDDRIGIGDDGLHHYDPRFRPGFDAELALQIDWIGSQFAVSRAIAMQLGWRSDTGQARHQDFALRAANHLRREQIRHLPRVLFHRTPFALDPVADRRDSVRSLLTSSGSAAVKVESAQDLLGAAIPGALRVRHAPPESTTATIIIPTRDQAGLLEGCIGSVLRSLDANCVSVEILIVDNGSEQPETFALLDRLQRDDRIRVIQHDGQFNWALINNRAAESATGDVLIFLNNDIVVFNPDCWDVLCGQAMRPDVGAVGARLLYEDGTIQHAGMVLGDWNAYLTHEGVGALGSDPGYMGRHALVREVAGVTGACLATRRDVFLDAGGFDAANFPVECNDTDYCLRLQSLGYRILYDPNATLYHFESKSRGFNLTQDARERAFRATQCLRQRWEKRFPSDPHFNAHFDRVSLPFTKLVPPPAGLSQHHSRVLHK